MKYKLVVFDWDGTLMNSISHIVASLQHATCRMGIEALPDEQTRDVIGLGMREAIEALFPGRTDEQFIQDYTRYYRERFFDSAHQTELFAGAAEMLLELKTQGYQLAIATSKSRAGLDLVLSHLSIADVFTVSRCADETRSKPHADMLLAILDAVGIHHDAAVMVGDTVYDLEMAVNAKMNSIGVSYGVHNRERLLAHNPLTVIDAVTELPGFMATLAASELLSSR